MGEVMGGRKHTRGSGVTRAKWVGFTLIELMVALAVLSILLMVAVPGFDLVRNASRLSAGANDLVTGIQLARSEAIRRNTRVAFCQSSDGATCANSAAWTGWIVASDENRDGDFTDAGEVIRAEVLRPGIQVQGSPAFATTGGRVVFRPDGMAAGVAGAALLTATISVCVPTTAPAENQRLVHLVSGGRTAVARRDGLGVCAQPADVEA